MELGVSEIYYKMMPSPGSTCEETGGDRLVPACTVGPEGFNKNCSWHKGQIYQHLVQARIVYKYVHIHCNTDFTIFHQRLFHGNCTAQCSSRPRLGPFLKVDWTKREVLGKQVSYPILETPTQEFLAVGKIRAWFCIMETRIKWHCPLLHHSKVFAIKSYCFSLCENRGHKGRGG